MDSVKFSIALTQNFLQYVYGKIDGCSKCVPSISLKDVKSLLNIQVSDGNQKVLHSIPNKDILRKKGPTSTLMHTSLLGKSIE